MQTTKNLNLPSLPKAQELSKEQLAAAAESRKLRKQFKEKLWPFLEMSTKDLADAMALLDLAKMGIEAAWGAKKNKMTLKSLDVQLKPEAENYKKLKFLYDELQDESVKSSTEILTSLANTLNDYANSKISHEPMTALKEQFDKEYADV